MENAEEQKITLTAPPPPPSTLPGEQPAQLLDAWGQAAASIATAERTLAASPTSSSAAKVLTARHTLAGLVVLAIGGAWTSEATRAQLLDIGVTNGRRIAMLSGFATTRTEAGTEAPNRPSPSPTPRFDEELADYLEFHAHGWKKGRPSYPQNSPRIHQ